MRKKEGLADYRYFPEPDLPALRLTDEFIEEVRRPPAFLPACLSARLLLRAGSCQGSQPPPPAPPAPPRPRAQRRPARPPQVRGSMAELPAARRQRYLELGLPPADVVILADEVATARYFDAVLAAGAGAKSAANWVMGDIMAHCKVGGGRGGLGGPGGELG
jgi:aspartyl-tRNA(Asn)/glutamyl-tRNA(Gln) amidotransferase subunit B